MELEVGGYSESIPPSKLQERTISFFLKAGNAPVSPGVVNVNR